MLLVRFYLISTFVAVVLFGAACAGSSEVRDSTGVQAGAAGPEERPDLGAGFGADYPVFPLAKAIERNHLIVVAIATEDLGVREYSRVNLKEGSSEGTGSEESPGVRTTVRRAKVETVLKGTPPADGEILVEELLGTPNLTPGVRYLLILSPWHSDTYQAGAYGALAFLDGALRIAAGLPAADIFPQLQAMDFDTAKSAVEAVVSAQRGKGAPIAIVQPIPGREYDLHHLWSLDDVTDVSFGGAPLNRDEAARVRAALSQSVVAVWGPSDVGELVSLRLTLSGGQVVEVGVDPARGVARFADGVEVPLPVAARDALLQAR